MDITSLRHVGSSVIKNAIQSTASAKDPAGEDGTLFSDIFDGMVQGVKTTNELSAAGKEEKMKLALGETENTHNLTIATEKASTALQYTIAVRDKLLAAYKEIMQMQI